MRGTTSAVSQRHPFVTYVTYDMLMLKVDLLMLQVISKYTWNRFLFRALTRRAIKHKGEARKDR